MYIKTCLPESAEIKEQNAFSLMIPVLFCFPVCILLTKLSWLSSRSGWKKQLSAFDFLLCSVSVIFLCVSVYAYTCLHISPLKKPSISICFHSLLNLSLLTLLSSWSDLHLWWWLLFFPFSQNKELIHFIHIMRISLDSMRLPSTGHHQVTYENGNSTFYVTEWTRWPQAWLFRKQ